MKNIKTFESYSKFVNKDEAREIITKIYGKIIDEVDVYEDDTEFLVDLNTYVNYARKHNGDIASNVFDDLDDACDYIKGLYRITSKIYIAPKWGTRNEEEITNSDVYSDSIYIKKPKRMTIEELEEELSDECINLKHDEIDEVEGISGKTYIKFWWD